MDGSLCLCGACCCLCVIGCVRRLVFMGIWRRTAWVLQVADTARHESITVKSVRAPHSTMCVMGPYSNHIDVYHRMASIYVRRTLLTYLSIYLIYATMLMHCMACSAATHVSRSVPCGPFRSTHKIDFCLNSGPMI